MNKTIFSLLVMLSLVASPVSAMILPDIAFVRKPVSAPRGYDTANEIYTIDINGGNLVRLTDDDFAQLDPTFSPTDNLLSYYGNNGIFRMNFDGSDVQKLSGEGGGYDQSWSPDGSRLVFSKTASTIGFSDLYIVNNDGSGLLKINQDSGSHVSSKWSPSGNRIAYVSYEGTHIIDTNGLNKTDILSSRDYQAIWSPDGTKFYFSDAEGIWSVNPDGSTPIKVWSAPNPDFFSEVREKTISSDGKILVFTDMMPDSFFVLDRLVFLNLETFEIKNFDLPGYDLLNADLNWSKDKKYIIFRSFDRTTLTSHIFRYDYETGDLTQLTDGDFIDSKVHLRPSYAFYSDVPDNLSVAAPEPATVVLFSTGLLGALARRRRRF